MPVNYLWAHTSGSRTFVLGLLSVVRYFDGLLIGFSGTVISSHSALTKGSTT